jgi:hypothetical protein
MDVVLGTFLLLFSLDGSCTFARGALAGILHLYAWNTLLSFRPFASSLPFHFNLQLSTSRRSILLFEFRDEFFSWTRERRAIGCMDRFTLPDAMAFLGLDAWIDLRSQTLWLFSMNKFRSRHPIFRQRFHA